MSVFVLILTLTTSCGAVTNNIAVFDTKDRCEATRKEMLPEFQGRSICQKYWIEK